MKVNSKKQSFYEIFARTSALQNKRLVNFISPWKSDFLKFSSFGRSE